MKRQTRFLFLFSTGLILLATGLFQCETEDPGEDIALEVTKNGYSSFKKDKTANFINNFPVETLSEEETAGLVFMREEEKLARDLYINFSNEYEYNIFSNIYKSEATHMEAVKVLLDKYNLNDPVGSNGIGKFTNEDLEKSYDSLNAMGNQSLLDALRVGAAVEEIDILDLENQINNIVDNEDITFVYRNLRIASKNHLRAFVRFIEKEGETYSPQFLPQTQYLDIINDGFEPGIRRND